MTQEITLSLEESQLQFINEYAEKRGTTVSEIVEGHLRILQEIDEAKNKKTLHPWVQEFAGIVNTGKEESIKTIFE